MLVFDPGKHSDIYSQVKIQETERLRHDVEQLEKRNQLLENSVEFLNTARNIFHFGCDPMIT